MLPLILAFSAKADTIDNWQLYFNKQLVAAYNQYSKESLRQKVLDLNTSKGFSLVVNYRHCTLDSLKRRLTIQDEKGNKIFEINYEGGYDTNMPINLKDIIVKGTLLKNKIYHLYYSESFEGDYRERIYLANIRII
jgi:hypothetical protein